MITLFVFFGAKLGNRSKWATYFVLKSIFSWRPLFLGADPAGNPRGMTACRGSAAHIL